jgi:hypothetical protein
LVFVTVAVPIAAWALEQAARRAEAHCCLPIPLGLGLLSMGG